MNEDFDKRLLDAIKDTGDVPDELINEVFDHYSEKIAIAINPIGRPSAPFILTVLKAYYTALSKQFPGAEQASLGLVCRTGSACIKIPVKDGGQK